MRIGISSALLIAVLSASTLVSTNASARTWYVTADGTGDAPTIHAAMDSVTSGDVVLVAPGVYVSGSSIGVQDGVALVSENGPLETILNTMGPFPPVVTVGLGSGAEVAGFWIRGGQLAAVGVGPPVYGAAIRGNILGESAGYPLDAMQIFGFATIENNLILTNARFDGGGLSSLVQLNIVLGDFLADGGSMPNTWCNDLVGTIDASLLPGLNMSLDPQFCGVPGSGNYFLQSTSPCANGNDPLGCTAIAPFMMGPLPVGCGSVSIERRTWGAVKKFYEE